MIDEAWLLLEALEIFRFKDNQAFWYFPVPLSQIRLLLTLLLQISFYRFEPGLFTWILGIKFGPRLYLAPTILTQSASFLLVKDQPTFIIDVVLMSLDECNLNPPMFLRVKMVVHEARWTCFWVRESPQMNLLHLRSIWSQIFENHNTFIT